MDDARERKSSEISFLTFAESFLTHSLAGASFSALANSINTLAPFLLSQELRAALAR
jgi:hypothetical protein